MLHYARCPYVAKYSYGNYAICNMNVDVDDELIIMNYLLLMVDLIFFVLVVSFDNKTEMLMIQILTLFLILMIC